MSKMNKITRDTSILFRKLNVNIRKRAERVESGYPPGMRDGVMCGVGQGIIIDFNFKSFGTIYIILKPYTYISLLRIKLISIRQKVKNNSQDKNPLLGS